MASNLRVDTILPSTGTSLGIGTASGTINFLGNSSINTTGVVTATNFKTGSTNVHSGGLALGAGSTIGAVTGVTTYFGDGSGLTNTGAISAIASDGANRVLTSDGDGTATAHSFVTIENNRLSVNRGSGSGAFPLIVRRTDASGIIAEFANSSGYGLLIGQNSATGEAYLRTGTGQPMVFTTNAGSGIANERMRIDSSGNVGIGIDTINYPSGGGLTIYNATAPRLRLCNSSTGTGTHDGAEISIDNTTKDLYIENREGEDIIFYSGSERMRINTDGDLQIGQTANDTRLGIKARSSAVEFITCRNTSSTLKMYVHSSGNLYNTNGNYSQISDQSLKENIVDAKSQWNDIKNIKIRNFNFTSASGMDTHTQIGCVAQEVETVSPKLVSAPKDGVKTVANSVLYMKAVKALQEAQARIETLESKVAALEGS